jgi:hypothetical protein
MPVRSIRSLKASQEREMDTKGLNEFTKGVLMSLVTELADLKEHAQHIETSIVALAREHGLGTYVEKVMGS